MIDPKTDPQGFVTDSILQGMRQRGFGRWNGTSYYHVLSVIAGLPVLDGIPYETTPAMRRAAAELGNEALGSLGGWWRGVTEPRVARARAHLRWTLQQYRKNPTFRVDGDGEAFKVAMERAAGPQIS